MLSEAVKKSLEIFQLDKVPKMAVLRAKYMELCIERHPDKGGSNEQFQQLLEAKEILSKYIEENIPTTNDVEEIFARRQFKECNEVKINKSSVTIKYPSKYSDHYENILTKKYGQPNDNTETSNGKKFTVLEGIYITVYRKPGLESTLLIQGNQKLFEFVKETIPGIFKEILEICRG